MNAQELICQIREAFSDGADTGVGQLTHKNCIICREDICSLSAADVKWLLPQLLIDALLHNDQDSFSNIDYLFVFLDGSCSEFKGDETMLMLSHMTFSKFDMKKIDAILAWLYLFLHKAILVESHILIQSAIDFWEIRKVGGTIQINQSSDNTNKP